MQPSISSLFNVTTKQATITDTFDYNSIPFTFLSAFGNVTAKLGNTIFHQTTGYNANSDIVIGTNDSVTFDLPTSNQKVKSGSYTIIYDVEVNYGSVVLAPGSATFSNITTNPNEPLLLAEIDAALAAGEIPIIQFLNGAGSVLGSSTITETDGTNVIFFGSVTIASYASIGSVIITIDYSLTKEYTFDNCKVVTAQLTSTINCASAQITLQDTTIYPSYVSALTRQMTLRYPRLADGTEVEAAVTTSNPSLTVGPYIWSGGYLFSLESTMSWTQDDGLNITQVAVADLNKDVQCDAALCKVAACLYSLMSRYIYAVKNGATNTANLFQQNFISSLYVMNYQVQLGCGNSEKAAQILTDLMSFLSQDGTTECNCGCGDSTNPTVPTRIYPLYSSVALINGIENARIYQ